MANNTDVWITQAGRKIRVCDMTDQHLVNTIAFLERRAEAEWEGYLQMGNMLNGEIATDLFEDQLDHVCEYGLDPGDFYPIYHVMIDEQEKRGLFDDG